MPFILARSASFATLLAYHLGFHTWPPWPEDFKDCEKCSSDLELGHELLRDLRWTQSECLELREAKGLDEDALFQSVLVIV